jgi:exopolysaccharide biosynthesis WecB/TagA/CpsF family protein
MPIYLYGSKAEVLRRLSVRLSERFPRLIIAGTHPSAFRRLSAEERDELTSRIRQSEAAIVFVGLGCPRQEVWCYENRDLVGIPLVAVGAAFDFHAGLVPQAPAMMQRIGLEWLHRLAHDPRRLWRRYLYLNPYFLALVLRQMLGHPFPVEGKCPVAELRVG